MSYRVRFTRRARNQLAAIWIGAPDRNAVTAASHAIEQSLAADPFDNSESRARGRRIIIVKPLSAQYVVSTAKREVKVIWIHRRVNRPPRP